MTCDGRANSNDLPRNPGTGASPACLCAPHSSYTFSCPPRPRPPRLGLGTLRNSLYAKSGPLSILLAWVSWGLGPRSPFLGPRTGCVNRSSGIVWSQLAGGLERSREVGPGGTVDPILARIALRSKAKVGLSTSCPISSAVALGKLHRLTTP